MPEAVRREVGKSIKAMHQDHVFNWLGEICGRADGSGQTIFGR
jgi:hypothetical protein